MNDYEIENVYNEIVGNLERGDTVELLIVLEGCRGVTADRLSEFIARRGFESISGDDRREHMLETIEYVRG